MEGLSCFKLFPDIADFNELCVNFNFVAWYQSRKYSGAKISAISEDDSLTSPMFLSNSLLAWKIINIPIKAEKYPYGMIYCFNTNFWFLNPFWYLVELLILVIRTIRNHLWFIRRISTVNCHFWPLPVAFRNSDWANSALSFRWNKSHFCRLNVTQLQIHRNYLHFFKYFVRQYARVKWI